MTTGTELGFNPLNLSFPLRDTKSTLVDRKMSVTVGDLLHGADRSAGMPEGHPRKTEVKIRLEEEPYEVWVDLPDMVAELNSIIGQFNCFEQQPELMRGDDDFFFSVVDRWLMETTGRWIDDFEGNVDISVYWRYSLK
tara:strand:- start:864 stop:1277 length:414 start_codon:yes stop_codon:yes gene_type:complete